MDEDRPIDHEAPFFRAPGAPEARDHNCIWHPFTAMSDWMERDPLIIESGQGVRLRDIHGREYYDGNSSLWVNIHGHRHPRIDAAIRDQLDRIAHPTMLGLSNMPAIKLAERLVKIAPPGLRRVFYSDSGSEAVEIALKIAFQHWQLRGEPGRTHYLTLANGYHGDTLGAVSVGGIETFHALFRPLLFPTHWAPSPGAMAGAKTGVFGPVDALQGFTSVLAAHQDRLAAVIMEPLIQAAGGMVLMPGGFLKGVERACHDAGVLLIVDEVATGFGRTGRMFACEHEDVHPDLMTVAKGLTGGYLPLAATLATDRVFEPFLRAGRDGVFYHGHSYTGNPLGCAAALASLDIFEDEHVVDGLAPKIRRVTDRLQTFKTLSHVQDIRQIGLMVGIEIGLSPESRVPYPSHLGMGAEVCARARDLGMITRPLGDVVIFLPPLCSTTVELGDMLNILYQAIRDVTEAPDHAEAPKT